MGEGLAFLPPLLASALRSGLLRKGLWILSPGSWEPTYSQPHVMDETCSCPHLLPVQYCGRSHCGSSQHGCFVEEETEAPNREESDSGHMASGAGDRT